jgi:SHS2 domain-containing protein
MQFTMTTPDWLEFLNHTADAGILVQAADLKELFARAAWTTSEN